jgi:hypothetical protein
VGSERVSFAKAGDIASQRPDPSSVAGTPRARLKTCARRWEGPEWLVKGVPAAIGPRLHRGPVDSVDVLGVRPALVDRHQPEEEGVIVETRAEPGQEREGFAQMLQHVAAKYEVVALF